MSCIDVMYYRRFVSEHDLPKMLEEEEDEQFEFDTFPIVKKNPFLTNPFDC